MAFDYGSIDLGLRNPFKKEGLVTAIRGGIQFLAGLFPLLQAAGRVKEDTYTGNASHIHQLNQQGRAMPTSQITAQNDAESAGYKKNRMSCNNFKRKQTDLLSSKNRRKYNE